MELIVFSQAINGPVKLKDADGKPTAAANRLADLRITAMVGIGVHPEDDRKLSTYKNYEQIVTRDVLSQNLNEQPWQ